MWAFCTQLDSYDASTTQAYLDQMAAFESDYPDVTFQYMTGNAQAEGNGGYNRHLRNEQIRQYCIDNNKWLFDFGDLDCWYGSDQHTYVYNEQNIPSEHPQFNGDEAAHTTLESCTIKGVALWWLMARIAGWDAENVPPTGPSICIEAGALETSSLAVTLTLYAPDAIEMCFSNNGTTYTDWEMYKTTKAWTL